MRILITRSNPIAPDPRVEKIFRTLSSAGYSVRVLGWDRSAQLPQEEIRGGVSVSRLLIQATYGKGLANFPQLLRWQWGLWRWLAKHHAEYDLIHACDFDTILPAILIKAIFGKRIIYDIFDFYADHLRATPPIIKSMIRRVDLWAVGRADWLILVDESRREQVRKANIHNISTIYNSPEDVGDRFTSTGKAETGKFTLAYIGLLQIERGLLEIISVLKRHPEWQLNLAGFGGDEQQIIGAASNLQNIHWYGRVNYEVAMQMSASADILFATYDPKIPNHKYASPNKIFEAMMLGKPVIVAEGTNMDRIVERANCGIIVPYGDVPALEKAIQSLADKPELAHQLGINARKAYETQYDWKIMSQRLIRLYEEVIEK